MNSKLAALETKLRNNEIISYEEGADIFENTVVGMLTMQQNRLTRDDVIVLLRSRFQTEEALSESLREMLGAFDQATKGRVH